MFPCKRCGKLVKKLSYGLCPKHAWAVYIPVVARRLRAGLKHTWSGDLFERYAEGLATNLKSPGKAIGYLRKDVRLFVLLEENFKDEAELTGPLLIARVGQPTLIRYRRATGFLHLQGLIGALSDPDCQWALVEAQIHARIERVDADWARRLLRSFLSDLRERVQLLSDRGYKRANEPVAPYGIRSAMNGAAKLLQWATTKGASGSHEVTGPLVRKFMVETSTSSHLIGRFVKYLNSLPRFRKLSIPKMRSPSGLPAGVLSAESFSRLLAHALTPATRRDLPSCITTCLCLLYAQPPRRIIGLRLADLRIDSHGIAIRFAAEYIPLTTDAVTMIRQWLDERCELAVLEPTKSSGLLFPGRTAGLPINAYKLARWLRPHGVQGRQLACSGLANLVRQPDFHPRVAIDGLGVNRGTVARYMELLAPSQGSQVASVIAASRKPGRLS